MIDFAHARRTMVDCQIRTNDVTESRVVDAFLDVPRERFVPQARQSLAYLDTDMAVGGGRFMMQPMYLAKLVHSAKIQPGDAVLDVGTGLGYSAAILAELAAKVVALESDEALVAQAKVALAEIPNVTVVQGALPDGAPSSGPYDVILFQGAVEEIPASFFYSLKEGGRLVAVVGNGKPGRAMLFVKVGGDHTGRITFDANIPRLQGFARAPAFTF